MVQKTKTLSLCSIKKLFKLRFNKLGIFISLLLFSCTSHLIQAEEIKPENLKCGSSSGVAFFEKNGLFALNDEDFNYKLGLIDKNLTKEDFNFIYISKPQNTGGYTLNLEKIIKKKDKHQIYFKENKPPQGSANIMAITATYCFLKINNLDKVKVIIK
tara:strand:+ start:1036 stop:1509 length:474 start_codon:yes stop_codon:yes gene_type:complete